MLGFYIYLFCAVGDSAYNFLFLSATAFKITKWRFSSQNHQLFEFLDQVLESPTHTGLICVKTTEPNMLCLAPFK